MWTGGRRSRFDIAYVGDFRSDPAIVGAVADEIAACGRAGYETVLIGTNGGRRARNAPVHPAIRACIRNGHAVAAHDPESAVEARLAILHRPLMGGPEALERLRLRARRTVVVAHEASRGGDAKSGADAERLASAARDCLGGEAFWAAAWQSAGAEGAALYWLPVVDPARFAHARAAPSGRFPVVGRHGPPEKAAWPQTMKDLLTAFPIDADLDIRLLGLPPDLLSHFGGACPSNWTLYDYGWMPPERFLREVDFFISPDAVWPAGSEVAVLEALASGAVVALPRALAEVFEGGAIYPAPGAGMVAEVTVLHRDARQFREQVARGHELLRRRHAPRLHEERVRALIGKPGRSRARRARPSGRSPAVPGGDGARAVLFVATNGIGLGHLVQLLSIARRLPEDVKPVFATNSQAIAAVRGAGYPVHFLPDDRYAECNTRDWNLWLERELDQLIDLYGASGLVFSGVWCFDGVVRAGAWRGEFGMAWVRIPMWKRPLWDQSVERAKYFDLVIDTGEVAARRNIGARIPYRDKVADVPPLLLCDDDDLLDRAEARRRLGLRQEGMAVLLQLGAGNNTALTPVVDRVLQALRRLGPFQVVIAEWIISDYSLDLWADIVRLRDFPNAPYLPAFDFVMSASGYNTFHELIGYGIPTIFVPSEGQETDDQLRRAQFAEEEGLAFCLRVSELHRLEEVLARIVRPEVRERMRAACLRNFPGNGSAAAASLVADLVKRSAAPARLADAGSAAHV